MMGSECQQHSKEMQGILKEEKIGSRESVTHGMNYFLCPNKAISVESSVLRFMLVHENLTTAISYLEHIKVKRWNLK